MALDGNCVVSILIIYQKIINGCTESPLMILCNNTDEIL